jgi:ubiquitin carboxyl-terminal hydrolase 47
MEEKEKLSHPKEEQVLTYLKQGDFVYELYSVLVHSGGANSGHYYCYIKSFEDGKWYNFNDGTVSEMPEIDV